jgi:hypothetical protein
MFSHARSERKYWHKARSKQDGESRFMARTSVKNSTRDAWLLRHRVFRNKTGEYATRFTRGRRTTGTPMTWLDHCYSSPVPIPLSVSILAIIGLLSWREKGRQVILALTLFSFARYLLWSGLYTLNTDDWPSLLMSWTVIRHGLTPWFRSRGGPAYLDRLFYP